MSFIPGHTSEEIIAEYNKRFSEPITIPKLNGFKRHHKIHSGLPKGRNANPIGHECIKNGFIIVKTGDTPKAGYRNYKPKHYVLWEKVNGPVPEGYNLIFLDGNKRNFHLENIELVTKEELGIITRLNLQSEFAEITKTGILIARVIAAMEKKRKNGRSQWKKRKR